MAGFTPSPIPTPIRATPAVPMADQEEPVASEVSIQARQAVAKNMDGEIIFSPQ